MKLNGFLKAVPEACFSRKILLVMKLSAFLIMFVLVTASAKTYSQITLNEKNVPLEKVFKDIKQQTGYAFFYDANDIKDKTVNIDVNNTSLDQVLSICLHDFALQFKIVSNEVVITKTDVSTFSRLIKALTPSFVVSGTVSDDQGPMPGVTVSVKGSNTVTATNDKGEFSVRVNQNDILVFSFIGYKKQEVIIKDNNSPITITLQKDINDLDQVVVIAYGSTKKKDLTGAVSTISADEVQDAPFNTIDNALAGKAAGVEVTKTDGTPGGAVRIRIRGSSSLLGGNNPLYVIDGVPLQVQSSYVTPGYDIGSPVGNDVTGLGGVSAGLSTAFVNGLNSLGGLNPDDIESITILKDASSTAIYGSKAANGVVIITTKKGRHDMAPQVTASYYSTVSTPITPKLLNASQYRMLMTEAAQNTSDAYTAAKMPVPSMAKTILNSPSTFFSNGNTDWIKQVTRNAVAHNAELSVQGGGNKSRYFSSISYNNTPGVVDATSYQRISGKINLDNEINDHLKFVTNIILGFTDQNIGDGAYGQALRARPDFAPYDANGNFTGFTALGPSYLNFQNPVALLTAVNEAKTFSLLGSLSGIYDFNKHLQFKSMLSLNMQAYNQRNYTPSYVAIGSFDGNISNNGGIGSNSNSNMNDWFFENTLSYNKTFNEKHAVDVLVGTSYETRKNSFFSATGEGYPNDNVLTSLSSAVTPLLVRGDDPTMPQSYLLSFYLRANYGYMDKYLFTFTGRADGSSKFGPNNKFGYFPSGAVAWRISKEDFLKNVTWIDDIKLRASYGLTGNQNIGDQMYRTLYSPLAYNGSSALIPSQLGDQNIKWESTTEFDAGADLAFFKNRLNITFDYYNKRTSGALLALPVAPSSSYTSLLTNAVGIKNSGYEFSISGDIIRAKDFKWNGGFNITFNKSLVTKLNSTADLSQLGDLTGLETGNTTLVQGQPLGLITGLKVTGIIKTQQQLDDYKKKLGFYAPFIFPYLGMGDPMFELQDQGGGNYYPNFNVNLGSAAPKFFGGFTQGFTYKKFDLQLYFTYSEGGKLLWGDHISSMEFEGTSNANVSMLNRWTPNTPNATDPRLLFGSLYYKSNLDLFNSSYLKLRTIQFNYHLNDSRWMKKAGMHNLVLFASATNIFTITKYPGNDPETSDDPYSVNGGYFDVSNYPTVRTFSLGIKTGF